jgi:hypothetical protein
LTNEIAAKGTQLAGPAGVDFEFDADNSQFKVTITPPTEGIIPARYNVSVYRGTSQVGSGSIFPPETTELITWYSSPTDGSYTVRVTGQAGAGSYFKESDPVVSAAKTYAALFNSGANISGNMSNFSTNSSNEITGVIVQVSLNNIWTKEGATYSFERAPVDANGVEGAWAAVTLKAASSGTDNFVLPGLDILGNMPSNVRGYDQNVASGTYRYRVKAEKAGQSPQYKTTNSITLDKIGGINGSISVGSPVTSGDNRTYSVSPSFYRIKGALAEGDKLVIYWSTSSNSGYTDAHKIEFTKTELEAAAVTPKNIETSNDYYNIYAQAYIVTSAGGRQNVGAGNLSWSGVGVSDTGSYYWNNDYTQPQIYYAQLSSY